MTLEIRGIGLDITEAMRSHVRGRVRFALGRFGDRIRRVTVRVATAKGRHTCRVVASTTHSGRIVVEDSDRDGYVASGRSIARLGRTVARSVDRARMAG